MWECLDTPHGMLPMSIAHAPAGLPGTTGQNLIDAGPNFPLTAKENIITLHVVRFCRKYASCDKLQKLLLLTPLLLLNLRVASLKSRAQAPLSSVTILSQLAKASRLLCHSLVFQQIPLPCLYPQCRSGQWRGSSADASSPCSQDQSYILHVWSSFYDSPSSVEQQGRDETSPEQEVEHERHWPAVLPSWCAVWPCGREDEQRHPDLKGVAKRHHGSLYLPDQSLLSYEQKG